MFIGRLLQPGLRFAKPLVARSTGCPSGPMSRDLVNALCATLPGAETAQLLIDMGPALRAPSVPKSWLRLP